MADPEPLIHLTDGQRRILVALVEGYRARSGMKDRIRALNEWEIARRSGSTALSYAEFSRDAGREELVRILGDLQRMGLISTQDRGGNYDTFVPTTRGDGLVAGPASPPLQSTTPNREANAADPIVERLDEVIRLLKSIETRLNQPR